MERLALALTLCAAGLGIAVVSAQRTVKPVLHAQHWLAITGKPLAATPGAMMFQKGGNAVDAACAMLGAASTMWDTLGWGGETQALIYNPKTGKVIGVNALGVAPTGATPEFYRSKGMAYPPEYGPLAAVTPAGRLLVMPPEQAPELADAGPVDQMADGPIEQQAADAIERTGQIRNGPVSGRVPDHPGEAREKPAAGDLQAG